MVHMFGGGVTYLPHLPPAHFLATGASLHLPAWHFPASHFGFASHFLAFDDAHLPLAAHFALAAASPPVVHPVKPTIAKPTSAVNINFFILSPI